MTIFSNRKKITEFVYREIPLAIYDVLAGDTCCDKDHHPNLKFCPTCKTKLTPVKMTLITVKNGYMLAIPRTSQETATMRAKKKIDELYEKNDLDQKKNRPVVTKKRSANKKPPTKKSEPELVTSIEKIKALVREELVSLSKKANKKREEEKKKKKLKIPPLPPGYGDLFNDMTNGSPIDNEALMERMEELGWIGQVDHMFDENDKNKD